MDSLVKEWSVFLDRCLEIRLQADLFDATATQLHTRSPLSGRKIAALLLKPRTANANSFDPRVVVYAERLLALKQVDASDVLASAYQYSKDRPATDEEEADPKDPSRWRNPSELEEILFHRLAKAFSGERNPTKAEGFKTLRVVTFWMSTMVTSHTNDSMMIQALAGIQQHPQQQSINVREALGMLVVGLVENNKILQLLTKDEPKADLRKQFAQALSNFIPFLSQTSIQIANRLEYHQKEHDFYDKTDSGASEEANENAVAALQLDAVIDLPSINTRAGLYIFLNSLLVARPLTDDFTITNYLSTRYKMDAQTMATDLVTASFDILANAMYRSEPSQTIFSLKSFLVNKIPLILIQLTAAPMYAMNPELCIQQALSHVDPNAFPSFSQGFDMMGNNSPLSEVRQDFLNACALHGLIQINTVERLLGEAPMQGPPATKYVKQDLLAQFKENFEKVNIYIEELDSPDGNAGAIVGAITEFVSHLCETQTTMYLKTICSQISKKTQALDVILQFTSPVSILRPMCQFLDEWRYEGDQGECQPVYDEFAAILVLIVAFVYRYDLTHHDLGINNDSFVAQFLERSSRSVPPDELTEEQGKHLGSWLRDLYDSDKEGLSNEVFASCRPQDFYFIVPTLFSQTVMACSAEVLSLDTVKGGLEYLHETFLLPALVGGLLWMASHAMTTSGQQDLDTLMQIFEKLIRSSPTSGDAQAMHTTILCAVSARLEKCFRTLRQRHPKRTDIEPLLQALKGKLDYERTVYSSKGELEQWTSATNNTFNTSLRHTVQQLTQWASSAGLQPNPPNYTHRQIYTCIKLTGAFKTLRAIIDEIKAQTDAGNGAAALDIGVSIICAPTIENSALPVDWVGSAVPAPTPPRTRMNLREALKCDFDNAAAVIPSDHLAAETIVRLHRRVESLISAISQASGLPNANVDLSAVNLQAQSLPTDLDKAINDAAADAIASANGDISGIEGMDIDMNKQALQREMDDLDLSTAVDLTAIGVGNAGMGTDIQMGDLPDLNLDDMGDMGMGVGDGDDWGLDFSDM
ncbi:Med5-domain-containing protein [Massarina eburnea CBS 473.64]|uniref:Mediator of RNA polymerase II transcription subunit 5 n=1 Tax=Massarina eburnea CBS 473.64 TaxID=1395130 RepID=A0A6A6RJZ6_9PLEO|nr:Med5-domain-containing protein [Massarina eburnea CBS 473.64]